MITTLEGLLEQHAWAALQISGADQTAWNGTIVEAGQGVLGLAHWDGTLHLDREYILEPLRDMYEHAGEPRTEAALLRSRDALVTLLHEQSHFLGPTGATQEDARDAFKLPGGRVLEEGVAEAWAHEHLDEYIRQLGIDKVAPGITEVRSDTSYAAFVPAVRLLTEDLDRQSGASPGETLHLLNRQTAEGQWPLAVDIIYNSSRLPDLVPPEQADSVRLHLEQGLRNSFKSLELYEPFPRGFASSRSQTATTKFLTTLHKEVATAEEHFTPTPPATQYRLSPVLSTTPQQQAFAGVAPPGSLSHSASHSPSPSPAGARPWAAVSAQRANPALER